MAHALSLGLLSAAALGLAVLLVQLGCLWGHLRRPSPVPRGTPGISVLKPLCGLDDQLEENLLCFADLDWSEYEVLLGVRDRPRRRSSHPPRDARATAGPHLGELAVTPIVARRTRARHTPR